MVRATPELARIAALPRRQWEERVVDDPLTPLLRTPVGTQRLRPLQIQALLDAGTRRGLFAPIRVGGGKTLISLLSPYILDLNRPLLLLPASLVEKTKREMRELSLHWRIPYQRIRILSYEMLGRVQSAHSLVNYRPDGIICDEVHRLRNFKAAVTRRVSRYMHDNPSTIFVGMSGTITKRSIRDYAHILKWIWSDQSPIGPPVPRGFNELEEWCAALDEKTNPLALTRHPGALLSLATPEDVVPGDETATARRAFQRRLRETPGVVATTQGYHGPSLRVTMLPPPAGPSPVEGAFAKLREKSLTPDNWLLPDGMSVWRVARELALEFYYIWDPRPPEQWCIYRQAWAKFVRSTIQNTRRIHLDSELQVAQAVARGEVEDPDGIRDLWKAVEPTFRPNSVPVWLGGTAVHYAAEWAKKHKGIVWVEHGAFGERLSGLTGLPFFRNGGVDASGRAIEDATGPIIASIASNSTGRNLQKWQANLVMSPPPNGMQWEQLLGRTHREGQMSDEVTVDVYCNCREHVEAMERAVNDSRYVADSTGQEQKLLYCDLTVPPPSCIEILGSRRFQ